MQDERNYGAAGGSPGYAAGGATPGGGAAGAANTPSFGGGTAGGSDGVRERVRDAAETVTDRAEQRATETLHRAGDRLEGAAERLDELADRQPSQGMRGYAADAGHTVADWLDTAANYLRDHDARALEQDIERFVRERPGRSLLIAVGAGWLVGKILR